MNTDFNSSETLLELYRDYSDKEKLNWFIRDYKELERKFRQVVKENKSLKEKNGLLTKKIKEDEEDIPNRFNGQKTVTIKAYWKLKRRCDMFEERVWELVKERNDKIEVERL